MLSSIIISKPHKALYKSPKIFQPIVLLNILSKLIEKAISKRLQFQLISKNFIHSCQLGELKQCSTTDAEVVLTHLIQAGQVKNFATNTLAFNIAQFFLSLNHQLICLILDKAGFDTKVSKFSQNYLVKRKKLFVEQFFFFFQC